MTIYDRARDALNNATPGPWEAYDPGDGTARLYGGDNQHLVKAVSSAHPAIAAQVYLERADGELAALAPELAAEVVRLHDELREIADEWEADAKYQHKHMGSSEAEASEAAAARIRAALEGVEE